MSSIQGREGVQFSKLGFTLPIVCDFWWSPPIQKLELVKNPKKKEKKFLQIFLKSRIVFAVWTFSASAASILLSSCSRSALTSLCSSLIRFQITWTFSWASRHSLPWRWFCSDVCTVGGLVLTSSWADSSWRDDTFCRESRSSSLIFCNEETKKTSKVSSQLHLNYLNVHPQTTSCEGS